MLQFNRISTYAYDIVGGSQDYHVRVEDSDDAEPWCVDIFNSGEVNNINAHIASERFNTLEDAIEFISDEEGEPNEEEDEIE